jgi:sporulation protein YlmC with PRC-barrel domain
MPEHDLDTILGWRGRTVLDRKGEKLGKVGDLYLDEATDRPAYAGVRTGLFGRHESIVPLEGIVEQEDDLVVPHDAELVRDAPAIDPDAALDEAEQERLARHYGGGGSAGDLGDDVDDDDDDVRGRRAMADDDADTGATAVGDHRVEADGETDADLDAGGRRDGEREGGEGMIRSEEEVVSGTTDMRPKERVRIRKVLVTDEVKRTVPVQREEIRLETDPPPEGDVESVRDVESARDAD